MFTRARANDTCNGCCARRVSTSWRSGASCVTRRCRRRWRTGARKWRRARACSGKSPWTRRLVVSTLRSARVITPTFQGWWCSDSTDSNGPGWRCGWYSCGPGISKRLWCGAGRAPHPRGWHCGRSPGRREKELVKGQTQALRRLGLGQTQQPAHGGLPRQIQATRPRLLQLCHLGAAGGPQKRIGYAQQHVAIQGHKGLQAGTPEGRQTRLAEARGPAQHALCPGLVADRGAVLRRYQYMHLQRQTHARQPQRRHVKPRTRGVAEQPQATHCRAPHETQRHTGQVRQVLRVHPRVLVHAHQEDALARKTQRVQQRFGGTRDG